MVRSTPTTPQSVTVDVAGLHRRMLDGADPTQAKVPAASESDDSAADFAFCRKLAESGKTAIEIDAAMRASRHMRPKWDEMRGGQTYGQRTIQKASSLQFLSQYSI